ncbi:MAG: hypothetical protein ABIR18_02050, partial [Chitinophagaceae bacterium]
SALLCGSLWANFATMRTAGSCNILLVLLLLCSFPAHSKPVHYSFISNWEIKAPLKDVWDLIDKGEDWHVWWRSVVKTKIVKSGTPDGLGQIIHYTWKSYLPFTLTIDFKITGKKLYQEIRGESTGDLLGTGVWTFAEIDGITYIQYQWEVVSTKKFVNFLSLFLKRFFTHNHNVIMHRGAKGLAKELHSKLISG